MSHYTFAQVATICRSGSPLQIEVHSTSCQMSPVHACFESKEEGLGVSISALQQHTAELST